MNRLRVTGRPKSGSDGPGVGGEGKMAFGGRGGEEGRGGRRKGRGGGVKNQKLTARIPLCFTIPSKQFTGKVEKFPSRVCVYKPQCHQ